MQNVDVKWMGGGRFLWEKVRDGGESWVTQTKLVTESYRQTKWEIYIYIYIQTAIYDDISAHSFASPLACLVATLHLYFDGDNSAMIPCVSNQFAIWPNFFFYPSFYMLPTPYNLIIYHTIFFLKKKKNLTHFFLYIL